MTTPKARLYFATQQPPDSRQHQVHPEYPLPSDLADTNIPDVR